MQDLLFAAATAWPEAAAVMAPEQMLSYSDLERLVASTAQRLQERGCAPGTRIGLYMSNSWQMVVLVLAAIRAGGVACPMSTRLPAPGIEEQLLKIDAPFLVTDRPEVLSCDIEGVSVVSPDRVVQASGVSEQDVRVAADQPATIVFTSGSTGEARAVLHSTGNHYYSAKGSNDNIRLRPGDRWLLVLPLYHVGGLGIIFRCLLAGATLVLPPVDVSLGEAVRRYGITHVSVVATQLRRWLQETAGGAPASLRAVLVGGSAVSSALVEEAYKRGYPLHTTYGMTEMTSQVTTTPPEASLAQCQTSGRCLAYREVRVAADGALEVRGEVLFKGYVEGGTVHRPVDEDGWFATGDRGFVDADGYLHVVGRLDNMFISGGENIYPEEIERALCSHEKVLQAVVVPVEDAEYGQRPVAFVQVKERRLDPEALAAYLEGKLPGFKIPTAFHLWPEDAPEGMKIDRAFFRRYAV